MGLQLSEEQVTFYMMLQRYLLMDTNTSLRSVSSVMSLHMTRSGEVMKSAMTTRKDKPASALMQLPPLPETRELRSDSILLFFSLLKFWTVV